MNKPFEQLDVIDDFLINAIASNPDVGEPFCKTVLSVLLQRKIDKLRIIAQKTIPAFAHGFRGIRMDVEIQEDIINADTENSPAMNIYDLEPHLQENVDFPRHNRFYQAKIDSTLMKSGDNNFSRMPNLYVLTITNFDIFGEDYMMYSFHNQCKELPELEYDDGLNFIYFYTGGTKGGSTEIKSMLRYLQKSTEDNISDNATRKIHELVSQVKILPEVKREYMRFEELMLYAQQKGYAKGHTEGLATGHAEGLAAGHAAGHAAGLAEGLAAGHAEGLVVGHAEGLTEGHAAGLTEGHTEGLRDSVIYFLQDLGTIPPTIMTQINQESDTSTLTKWMKLAAKSASIQDFQNNM